MRITEVLSQGHSIIGLISVVAVFVLVLSVWTIGTWIWALRRAARMNKVSQRLAQDDPGAAPTRQLRLWHDGKEVTTSVPGVLRAPSVSQRLELLREKAGWTVPAQTVLFGVIGATAAVCLVAFVLTGRALAGVAFGAVGLVVFYIYVKQRILRRLVVFDSQFVEALELAARSLRAGHPLTASFTLASEEIQPPVGRIFGDICQQQEMGVSLKDALRSAAGSSDSADMKLFATSVIIQLESGGNLADMMDRLAVVVRERMRLARRVRVLTAQTQLSKRVLLALPFILLALLKAVNPEYMEPLFATSLGHAMLVVAGISLLVGMWLMNRLATLEY